MKKIKEKYKLLKAENKNLRQDIYDLIRKENEEEGIVVKMRWNMLFNAEDMVWMGGENNTETKFQGFLSQISIKANCAKIKV